MPIFPIKTDRMFLVPATVKLYLLELHNREAFISTLRAKVPETWPPDQVTPEVIEEYICRMKARDRKVWSFYWLLCEQESEVPILIGNGGFLCHNNGILELGYSVLPEYQRKGYATEAVRSMLEWAFLNIKKDKIIAYTYPQLNASIRVLEKNGFMFKGKTHNESMLIYELLNKNTISGSIFKNDK